MGIANIVKPAIFIVAVIGAFAAVAYYNEWTATHILIDIGFSAVIVGVGFYLYRMMYSEEE